MTDRNITNDLRVSHSRIEDGNADRTGIYVRAVNDADVFSAHDIATLDRESLHKWLRSRGGRNLWAENTVLQLLGYQPFDVEPSS